MQLLIVWLLHDLLMDSSSSVALHLVKELFTAAMLATKLLGLERGGVKPMENGQVSLPLVNVSILSTTNMVT